MVNYWFVQLLRKAMGMRCPGACVFLFALFLVSLSQTPASSILVDPEIDDESEFNYVEGSGKGPEDWWRLNDSWRVCKCGKWQSPIDLKDPVCDTSLGELDTVFRHNEAILKNRGHDIMLEWPDGGGSLYIDGIVYTLRQCHWHTPAEHTFNGWRPDLEMHVVYQAPDSGIAVVGFLYKYGPHDPFLSKLEEPLKRLAYGGENNATVGRVTPWRVEGPQPYYRYMGSLTTPPCTEGVVWTVLARVGTVAPEQVQLLRDAVHDGMQNNSRPVQPTNGRLVRLYRVACDEHPSS